MRKLGKCSASPRLKLGDRYSEFMCSRVHTARALVLTISLPLCIFSLPAGAANWLILQGLEPAAMTVQHRWFGFGQVEYQHDSSTATTEQRYIPPKLIGPDLEQQSGWALRRLRLGLRGYPLATTKAVNYALAVELGNNGITAAENPPQFVDASLTLTLSDHQWLRAGQFKTPGAEEGLQAVKVANYINLSTVTSQLVLERFPNRHNSQNLSPISLNPASHSLNGFKRPSSAFRDIGLQWFGVVKKRAWETSVAGMIGNGNGINAWDNDKHKELYAYITTEKPGLGKGARRLGLKFLAWFQQGKRSYDADNNGHLEAYRRTRYGVGAKWLTHDWHASAEYMRGTGMIFLGPDKASFDINGPDLAYGDGLKGRANGWYIDTSRRIGNTGWELNLRYDRYHRLTHDPLETHFTTLTVGAQWLINANTHITFNVADRAFRAINYASAKGPNIHLAGVDRRYGISLFRGF